MRLTTDSYSSYIIRGGAGFLFSLPHPTHSRSGQGAESLWCRYKAKGRNLIHCNVTSPCPLHLWVASSFSFQKICHYATASHATRPPNPLPKTFPYPIHHPLHLRDSYAAMRFHAEQYHYVLFIQQPSTHRETLPSIQTVALRLCTICSMYTLVRIQYKVIVLCIVVSLYLY